MARAENSWFLTNFCRVVIVSVESRAMSAEERGV
jgi:hypothetical protein